MQVNPLKSFLQLSSSELQTSEVWLKVTNDLLRCRNHTIEPYPSTARFLLLNLKHRPKDANRSDKVKRRLERISHMHVDILQ